MLDWSHLLKKKEKKSRFNHHHHPSSILRKIFTEQAKRGRKGWKQFTQENVLVFFIWRFFWFFGRSIGLNQRIYYMHRCNTFDFSIEICFDLGFCFGTLVISSMHQSCQWCSAIFSFWQPTKKWLSSMISIFCIIDDDDDDDDPNKP